MVTILMRRLIAWTLITTLLFSGEVLAGYRCAQFLPLSPAAQAMANMPDCAANKQVIVSTLCQADCENSATLITATTPLPLSVFLVVAQLYPTSNRVITLQPMFSLVDSPPLITPSIQLQYQTFLI